MFLDPRTPYDPIERIGAELTDLRDRIDRLAAATGTEAYQSVAKLAALITDIQAQLDEYLSNDAYTKAQVDARIVNPGLVGNVASAGTGRFDGGLASTGAYNELLSGSGGSIRALWIHPDGRLGYLPSDEALKLTPQRVAYSVDDVLKLHAVLYQYRAVVPYDQAQQPEYLGLLAQEVHAAGFQHLVDYDESGSPAGVRYAELGVVLLEGFRSLVAEVRGE